VGWDVLLGNGSQVALRSHREVLLVQIAQSLVDLTCEYALMAQGTEREVKASEPREEIDKSKPLLCAQLAYPDV